MKFFVQAFIKDARGLQLLILISLVIGVSAWLKVHPLIALLAGLSNGMALSSHLDLIRWRNHAETVAQMTQIHGKAVDNWVKLNRRVLRDHYEAIAALFQGVKILSIHVGLAEPFAGYEDPPPWNPDLYGGPSP
jgi:hypothetical protein